MANAEQIGQARKLLQDASSTQEPLAQRLVIAAAFSTVMSSAPIVVGGTAEEFWTRDPYRPTDLDLIPGPSDEDIAAFQELGLKKEGRHWVRHDLPVGTEFPHDESFEVKRTFDETVNNVVIKVIGVDDLYLDRLGQTTATENVRDQHFASLMAIALTNWDSLDWRYIEARITETTKRNPPLAKSMRTMHRRCLRKVRQALAERRAKSLASG